MWPPACLEIAVNKLFQLSFAERAYLLCDDLSVPEKDQGRNTANTEFGRHGLVAVHIQFGNGDFAAVFGGYFVMSPKME